MTLAVQYPKSSTKKSLTYVNRFHFLNGDVVLCLLRLRLGLRLGNSGSVTVSESLKEVGIKYEYYLLSEILISGTKHKHRRNVVDMFEATCGLEPLEWSHAVRDGDR